MNEASQKARKAWKAWISKEIGGSFEDMEAAMQAVDAGLVRGDSSADIATAARAAVKRTRAADSGLALPPETEATPTFRPDRQFQQSSGGIYDLVVADISDLGRAAKAALDAIELKSRPSAVSFFAAPGFRGRYGWFGGTPLSRLVSFLPLILWICIVLYIMGVRPVPATREIERGIIGGLWLIFLWFSWCLVITPIKARNCLIEVAKARVLITYGILRTEQIAVEVHKISEVSWKQTLAQKIFGQATLVIDVDTPSRTIYRLMIPGIVPRRAMQDYVNRMRTASQRLRQGQGRFYPGGFVN